MFFNQLIVFAFSGKTGIPSLSAFLQCLEYAVNSILSALECRNDILRRRLEQSNQFGDEFVLGLDSAQELEILLAYIDGFLYISSFELRLSLTGLVALGKLLDEFSRHITRVAEHESGVALECLEDSCIHALLLKRFLEQCILSNQEFDVLFEARATQVAGLRSIQTLDIYEIEVRVLSQLCAKSFNDEIFIFLFLTCLLVFRD